ncbi:sigma-E factor negative regulatory protein [Cupriavidus sp. AU9028]|uniref:sigma-E factor negative regulatory protein n=1 Tax=Cupriavidus sp. AU9028 TaxID=2871157 RepID=UPI001C97E246|nr:RseA family anti-sigma factor [Cupriavidus sp. AU9028]MBY4896338.1 sigma-E factor negative regulatory protein [Cupriavidus sp. AU9028]
MGQAHRQSVHASEAAEQISALIDGELAPHEFEAVIELAKAGQGRADWSAYQLIGDTLRSEELAEAGSTDAFVSRFAARLEQEPHLLAPAALASPPRRHRLLVRPSWVRRVMPGTAIAAAVAAVSWVVVPQMRDADPAAVGAAGQVVAQAPVAAQVAPAPAVVAVSADPAMIRDPRLDEYLRAHRVSVPTSAAVPAMRNVANSASFSQENTQE